MSKTFHATKTDNSFDVSFSSISFVLSRFRGVSQAGRGGGGGGAKKKQKKKFFLGDRRV
jgi:hypothetical protein